jgi:hypothetical protein
MSTPSTDTSGLSVLGATVRHAIDHVEVFPAPADVRLVRFRNDELNSMCPVTEQPDLSTVEIEYEPDQWCVESKSLKLYLWRFRNMPVFAEALRRDRPRGDAHGAAQVGSGHAHPAAAWRYRSAGSGRTARLSRSRRAAPR